MSVLEEKVASAPPGSVVLVNSACMRDLEAVVLACYRAEALRGKDFMWVACHLYIHVLFRLYLVDAIRLTACIFFLLFEPNIH